jgi:hypothetical protein
MELENAIYAGVQIAHNFGAAAVAGLPVAELWFGAAQPAFLRPMVLLTFLAWLIQGATGVGFGAVSYFMEGELPEIHHAALAALIVKIFCAVTALALLSIHFLRRGRRAPGLAIWRSLCGLGLTALTAAAVLRWFS